MDYLRFSRNKPVLKLCDTPSGTISTGAQQSAGQSGDRSNGKFDLNRI